MEVIPSNTNENTASKAILWAERILAFQEKRAIPQRLVSAKRALSVYPGLLDPQAPARRHRDGQCFRACISLDAFPLSTCFRI